jgi:hypothetical protein
MEKIAMSNNQKTKGQIRFSDDQRLERMSRNDRLALIQQVIDEFYREGRLVKALDESGDPLFRDGLQVYKSIEHATATERAFWNMGNTVN